MAKKKRKVKRRRTTSEKVIIVLGIIIALSMILSLVAGLGNRSRGADGSSSLPEDFGVPIALEIESTAYETFMSTYDSVSDLYRT
ncbi:unnamed protein product [marine sediment metagenome]|uniref:Uncharacterized protein n=1 Tax=marine sediment metagenome TaxID=412755 RepID=X1BJF5_9ZZZZ